MAAIEGIDQIGDFADDMRDIAGQSRGDGIDKAKRDALRKTANEFKDILKEQIMASNTAKGGTLYSETSPYTGGENESTDSEMHLRNKTSWETEVVGNDTAIIYPHPEIFKRASWLEYGTDRHGPSGDEPMYFFVNGVQIVVTADKQDNPLSGEAGIAVARDRAVDDESSAEPGEVDGIEPQGFFRKAIQIADRQNIFKKHMANEVEKLFEEQGYTLEGDW